eukprot:CAMPEP_0171087492 /NCGR_PEP_ID=MMETSP0766_2-20121228/20179_1 /TAXON_ID=439317 /ORGANISM="Gambierdiscus australes, Strain CAWD 149" /LENGTH=315 /DNA_ID=CAMNT_0011545197 /DNA_START=19 /DNA_END=966 /DNA_ORIENTATION=+
MKGQTLGGPPMTVSQGRLLGQLCSIVLFGIVLLTCACTFIAYQWPGPGFHPSRGRQLYYYPDEIEDRREVFEATLWLRPIISLGAIVFSCCCMGLTTIIYHALYIKGSAERYLPRNVVVPQDMKGRWAHDKCDCGSELGTFCCHCWCAPWVIVETWYRAGFIHAFLGPNAGREIRCPGWQYFAGVGGYFLTEYVAGCCMCCLFAVLRGGVRFVDGGSGGLGEIEDHRKRFELPHSGWNTFCEDCCCWCWCGPCIGTQEYRQVMDLLNRQPQVASHSAPQLVGAPVTVVGTPVVAAPGATVVSANNAKEGSPGWQG